jgi:hypothetical protein
MKTWLDDIEKIANEIVQIRDTYLYARKASELIDPVLFDLIANVRGLEAENAVLRRQLAVDSDNRKALWAALGQIREVVETIAPPGTVKNSEYCGPEPTEEAEAIITGIIGLRQRLDAAGERS